MAEPDRSPAALAQIIHNEGPGYKQGPFTLQSKTILDARNDRLLLEATATRGPNTWIAVYTTDIDGLLGKIYYVTDEDGRWWMWTDSGAAWHDAGVP